MRRRAFIAGTGAALLGACADAGEPSEAPLVSIGSSDPTFPSQPTVSSTAETVAPNTPPHHTPLAQEPFAVGVASGDPGPRSITLWSRLAGPDSSPLTDGDAEVEWSIARDESFDELITAGSVTARAGDRHVIRVTVDDLPPGWLYYRFQWQGATSVTGRTRTTTRADSRSFRLALLSCQHYEEGWFVAHRSLVEDQPDLVVHVGDYIYGREGSSPIVRQQPLHDPTDLADYRLLYDTYRRDPDLQALHAAAPMVTVWDDHEVSQNDAGATPNPRRAAAYRAWWEQQAAPIGEPDELGRTTIHRLIEIDGLARLWMLDERQYRSDQVCGRLDDLPAHERCDLVDDPERTMLGLPQEAWLQEGFVDDGRWDLIAQQTVMADMSVTVGGVTGVNNDQWDGYAAARERLVTAAQTNPRSVVLSGDIHAAMVTTVRADTVGEGTVRDGSSENSGGSIAEFVAPSATTRMNSSLAVGLQLALLSRPDIHAFAPSVHGYVLIDLASERLGATYRNLDPLDPASQPATASQWSLTPDSRIPLGL